MCLLFTTQADFTFHSVDRNACVCDI